MEKEKLLKLIEEFPDCFVQKIKAYNRDFYNKISDEYVGRNFSEKLYKHLYGESSCKQCGDSNVRFGSFIKGYAMYCSKKCSNQATHEQRTLKQKEANKHVWEERSCGWCNEPFKVKKRSKQQFCCTTCASRSSANDELRLSKIKKTKQERYGDENYTNVEKAKETNLKRYGVENTFQSEEIKNKIRDTNLKNYGVEYSAQIPEVKEKIKKSNLDRYGVEYASQSSEIKEKIKQTNLKRYGVSNVFESIEIKNISKNTLFRKHGAEYPSQCKSIKEKILISSKKTNYTNVISRLSREGSDIIPLISESEYRSVSRENKYKFKCKSCNTIFEASINGGKSPTCNICSPSLNGISLLETDIYNYITSIYDGKVIRNYRKLLDGKEIDIYIPEKNIAIEFNGIYWHSEIGGNKNKKYHLNKTKQCESKGVRLLHIFEDEWIRKNEIVTSKIKHILKLSNSKSIFARNCYISSIENVICNEFIDKTHIQGKITSSIKLGLFDKESNNLVSVMTFGKLRKSLGQKSRDDVWELIRYSTDLNVNVVGGMSKLLSHFIKNYNPISIITYADRRYTFKHNNIYKQLDFKFVKETMPSYWYIKYGYIDRYHRYKFAKHNLHKLLNNFDPDLSEWENMQLNGYDRIWDCGHLKYTIEL